MQEHWIAIISSLLLIGLLTSYLKLQRSLQWWHCRRSLKLFEEADKVQNSLLQESFVVRRALEVFLAAPSNSSEASAHQCLAAMDRFEAGLKNLRDRLSPPYLEDSFLLALRTQVETWRSQFPALLIDLAVPKDWPYENYVHHRAILMVLDELMQIASSQPATVKSVKVDLQQQGRNSHLIIEFEYFTSSRLNTHAVKKELNYLKCLFSSLTSGSSSYCDRDSTMIWNFHWRLPN